MASILESFWDRSSPLYSFWAALVAEKPSNKNTVIYSCGFHGFYGSRRVGGNKSRRHGRRTSWGGGKTSLGLKNEALVWVCAHSADLRTLAPLQSEATLCRLTLPLEHATLKSRAHRHCTCTVDVAQAVYKYSCTVSVQEGGGGAEATRHAGEAVKH